MLEALVRFEISEQGTNMMAWPERFCALCALVLLTALSSATLAAPPDEANKKSGKKTTYDEKADAKKDIAKAVARAKKDNKRVLVMYGANWCGWCHKLHDLFESDREVRRALRYDYELVLVDIGRFDKNLDVYDGFGADRKAGVPFLIVLGSDGKPVVHQATGPLEVGPKHDPKKVLEFLKKSAPEPVDAEKVLREAFKRAAKEKKNVLVHLGAPW
jgi:thiol:disulfide interchange protein